MLRDQKLLVPVGGCILACGAGAAAPGAIAGLAGAALGLVAAGFACACGAGAVAWALGGVVPAGAVLVVVVVCAWTIPAKPAAVAMAITAVRECFIRTSPILGERSATPRNGRSAMMFPARVGVGPVKAGSAEARNNHLAATAAGAAVQDFSTGRISL